MTVTLTFDGVEDFDFDYTNAPAIVVAPASGASHATITGTYANSDIVSFPGVLSATYEYVQHWHNDSSDISLDTNNNTYATGTVNMTDFSVGPLTLEIRYYPELPGWAFDNEWHNSIRMAYALEYEPGSVGPCVVDSTCLQLDDSPGAPQNVISLLVIAGQNDWQDEDLNGRLKNDLLSVFNNGNENNNPTFYRHRGNDKILVIDEL